MEPPYEHFIRRISSRNEDMTAAEAAQVPDTEAVDLNDGQAQALALKPTSTEIERVISAVGSGPLRSGDPDAPHVPLWWVTAYDPEGNDRGIGTDVTLSRALAAAWILSHGDIADRFGSVGLGMLCAAPRAGWLDVRD